MRILIARSNHEANTFSSIPTPLTSSHPHYSTDAYRAAKGTCTTAGTFIDLTETVGVEIVAPVVTGASPSGRIAVKAYTTLHDAIVAAAPGCDALLLDLCGAMVTENSDDGGGGLLRRLRMMMPGVSIAVALNLHGNLTQKFTGLADIAVSFKTYPHVDMYETRGRTGCLLFNELAGRTNSVLAWCRLLMVMHTLRSRTDEDVMHHVVALARQTETNGMLAVSIPAGLGLADIAVSCLSVMVVGNGDKHVTDTVAQRIADAIWGDHEGFVYCSRLLTEPIAHAARLASAPDSGPMLLFGHGNNCMSGGMCDDMHVLHEALRQGLSGTVVGPVYDPEVITATIEAGKNVMVMLPVGDKMPLIQLGIYPMPRALTDKVVAISDGGYTIMGPAYTDKCARMGRAALLGIGAAQIVVTETPREHWDLDVFTHIDVDPHATCLVLLKLRMYCWSMSMPIARIMVECDDGGVTSSDYTRLSFMRAQRPVFPLDEDTVSA